MLVACAVHWTESLLFVAPVGLIAGVLKWSSWKADREERAAPADAAAAAEVA